MHVGDFSHEFRAAYAAGRRRRPAHAIVHGRHLVAHETRAYDLGRPARVIGLDCDGAGLAGNWRVLALGDLTSWEGLSRPPT